MKIFYFIPLLLVVFSCQEENNKKFLTKLRGSWDLTEIIIGNDTISRNELKLSSRYIFFEEVSGSNILEMPGFINSKTEICNFNLISDKDNIYYLKLESDNQILNDTFQIEIENNFETKKDYLKLYSSKIIINAEHVNIDAIFSRY